MIISKNELNHQKKLKQAELERKKRRKSFKNIRGRKKNI